MGEGGWKGWRSCPAPLCPETPRCTTPATHSCTTPNSWHSPRLTPLHPCPPCAPPTPEKQPPRILPVLGRGPLRPNCAPQDYKTHYPLHTRQPLDILGCSALASPLAPTLSAACAPPAPTSASIYTLARPDPLAHTPDLHRAALHRPDSPPRTLLPALSCSLRAHQRRGAAPASVHGGCQPCQLR